MDKLEVNHTTLASNSHILIDLSSYYKSSLAPKIELIQDAIEGRHYIQFDYYAPGGEGGRLIEPYLLVFQWASWYVWGWCTKREDYRLFKLNRMLELKVAGEQFEKRDLPKYEPRVEAVSYTHLEVYKRQPYWNTRKRFRRRRNLRRRPRKKRKAFLQSPRRARMGMARARRKRMRFSGMAEEKDSLIRRIPMIRT